MTGVLGLDPSITAFGVCLPSGTTFTITGAAPLGDKRLETIAEILDQQIISFRTTANEIQLAVMEDLPVHGKGAGITGMVQGVARLVLLQHQIPYVLVPAATLKAFATSSGNADKHAMRIAAFKRAGIEFKDDNQCDAWWLRQAGLHLLDRPEFPMPVANTDRLAKVRWHNLSPSIGVDLP